jgi:hypothetical protein
MPVPRDLPAANATSMPRTMVPTTSAAIAAQISNPITEDTASSAISTPTAMAASLNRRIGRFLSERAISAQPVSPGAKALSEGIAGAGRRAGDPAEGSGELLAAEAASLARSRVRF